MATASRNIAIMAPINNLILWVSMTVVPGFSTIIGLPGVLAGAVAAAAPALTLWVAAISATAPVAGSTSVSSAWLAAALAGSTAVAPRFDPTDLYFSRSLISAAPDW